MKVLNLSNASLVSIRTEGQNHSPQKQKRVGFKYIGNTALDLVKDGYEVLFGYEEAIGYMFGSEIRDKDGVAATVAFAEMVAALDGEGKTVKSYLDELYQR